MALTLDHVFVLVPKAEAEAAREKLAGFGLTGNVCRAHAGQGTANVLYCFDNAFLELLWIESEGDAGSPQGRRIGFADRSAWRSTGLLPFGIALRGDRADAPLPFNCWTYAPTWGRPLDVARSSDDLRQPFIFRGQRDRPPIDWPDDGAGDRQARGGFTQIRGVELALAEGVEPSPDLRDIEAAGLIRLAPSHGGGELILRLGRTRGDDALLRLPGFQLG